MRREEKDWMHYIKNIIAADLHSAVFLASYMKQTDNIKNYNGAFEIFDILKFKVIRDSKNIDKALISRAHLPFVFVVGKN